MTPDPPIALIPLNPQVKIFFNFRPCHFFYLIDLNFMQNFKKTNERSLWYSKTDTWTHRHTDWPQGWLLRTRVQNDDFGKESNLSEKAEKFWILEAQREIKQREAKKELLNHCPRIEGDIFVIGGRMERWMGETWNAQSFVLLPYNHPLSQFIVSKYHNVDHLGVSATVAKVHTKYCILNVHRLTKRTAKAYVIYPVKYKRQKGQV